MRLSRGSGILFLLFATMVSAAWASSSPEVIIISDIDDTVKATNVQSKWAAAFNGVFRETVFAGTPELYTLMSTKGELNFISASPLSLHSKLDQVLTDRGFPERKIFLRDWFKERDSVAFKTSRLEQIAAQTTAPIILLGDDTENDPAIYAAFMSKYPERVLAIYIHRIRGSELPPGQRPFFTAMDIAAWETTDARLSAEDASLVALAVLDGARETVLLPRYAACPKSLDQGLGVTPLLPDQAGAFQDSVACLVNQECAGRK